MICWGCGFEPPNAKYLELDHILPYSEGGSNELFNRAHAVQAVQLGQIQHHDPHGIAASEQEGGETGTAPRLSTSESTCEAHAPGPNNTSPPYPSKANWS